MPARSRYWADEYACPGLASECPLDLTFQAMLAIIAIIGWAGKGESVNTVSISRLKNELSEYLNRVAYGGERIIVTSRDRPKAVIISMADLERLEELEDAQAARDALAAHQVGETVPWEQVKAEMAGAERVPA